MSIIIGGVTQEKLLEILGKSRQQLFRYRNDPHWPGDSAPLGLIQAFVTARSRSSGRKPKRAPGGQAATPPAVPQEEQAGGQAATPPAGQAWPFSAGLEDMAEYIALAAGNLDDEMKRTVIEKNKTQIAAYQAKFCELHRRKVVDELGQCLRRFAVALEDLDLSEAQLENTRAALGRCLREMNGETPGPFQPTLL